MNLSLRPLGVVLMHGSEAPSRAVFLGAIANAGLAPRTVIDVGVASGTPWLYAAFPQAFFYLIEPTREALPHAQRWAGRLRAEVVAVALGAEDGTAIIDVPADVAGATLLQHVEAAKRSTSYEVSLRRMDTLNLRIERPCLCKIDVQGAELAVLDGMAGCIDAIDTVIVEASTLATLVDGPEVMDVMRRMEAYGFVLHDVLALLRRPLDRGLAQLDLAFVRPDSPLRADRRWGNGGG